jgi:hypothetical protein
MDGTELAIFLSEKKSLCSDMSVGVGDTERDGRTDGLILRVVYRDGSGNFISLHVCQHLLPHLYLYSCMVVPTSQFFLIMDLGLQNGRHNLYTSHKTVKIRNELAEHVT